MSEQIKFGLKNDAEAVYSVLNRKKEFFLVVHNFQGHYLPQVRVVITGPPEVRLKKSSEPSGMLARCSISRFPHNPGSTTLKAQSKTHANCSQDLSSTSKNYLTQKGR